MRQDSVLYADADRDAAGQAQALLDSQGIRMAHVGSVSELVTALDHGQYDVLLIDLALATQGEFLSDAGRRWPDLPLIAVGSGAGEPEAMQAMRQGAQDFLHKPLDPEELQFVVQKALTSLDTLKEEPPASMRLRTSDLPAPDQNRGLVGKSKPLLDVLSLLSRVARSNTTILVRGESGTGKELIARRAHEESPRAAGPFVKVHCGALPEQLLESELFGYEKGAFTGATTQKPGRVAIAEGGTLFLDEIGDISAGTQVKLLRVLQDRQYERLGGTKTLDADVRFVTATHKHLEQMVADGTFRQDLYYRLNVVQLVMPPLRERADDIPLLVEHFCRALGKQNGRANLRIEPEAVAFLARQRWPGNVRQLQNFVERLVVLSELDCIDLAAVQAELAVSFEPQAEAKASAPQDLEQTLGSGVIELDQVVRHAEKKAIDRALKKAKGNRTVAARILGVSRRTLYNKLDEHGVE